MTYFWNKRYGLPILYVDPAPELGPYIYQRAMLNAIPRPVRWWPTNWLLLPICWIIDFAKLIRTIMGGPIA